MSTGPDDTARPAEKMARRFATAAGVANAVLYEGYILYPYHATHGKNQGAVRFQWGVLVPPAWLANDPYERSLCRTELVVDPAADAEVAVRVRYLRLQHRGVEVADSSADGGFRRVEKLDVGGQVWMQWDEAIETELDLGMIPLLPPAGAERSVPFSFPATTHVELVTASAAPTPAGRILRTTEALQGEVRLRAQWADGPRQLVKLTIEVENTSSWSDLTVGREAVMRRSLIAVHTLAAVDGGSFCSQLDPPEDAVEAVAGCKSIASYPVLVGQPGVADLVLASPIILYDYPAIAPESEGDFHDGLEIDEILALRVMTLTDDEKAEARGTDPRARAIIERCDNMAATSWERLHGTMRDTRTLGLESEPVDSGAEATLAGDVAPVAEVAPVADWFAALDEASVPWLDPAVDARFDPWTDVVTIQDTPVSKGTHVLLHPKGRADVHDMFLAELTATVAGVFHDVDGGTHVAVTVDSDPASEIYELQGRFYYFRPDEVEPLTKEGAAP